MLYICIYIYIYIYTGQEKYWTSNLSAYWLVHLSLPRSMGKEVTGTEESHNYLLQRISMLSLTSTHRCQSPMFGHVRCMVSSINTKWWRISCTMHTLLWQQCAACSVGCCQICRQQSVRRCPQWRKGSCHWSPPIHGSDKLGFLFYAVFVSSVSVTNHW